MGLDWIMQKNESMNLKKSKWKLTNWRREKKRFLKHDRISVKCRINIKQSEIQAFWSPRGKR